MTVFTPTQGDGFASGLFQGAPAGPYAARDVWVALATDSSVIGQDGQTELRVWFVAHDFPATGKHEVHDVTLTGSQELSLTPDDRAFGELFVRVEHVSGGPWFGRVYEEFTS